MANSMYDAAREGFLDGSIDWDSDDIRVGLVPSTYVYSAAHKFVSDMGVTLNGRSSALSGRTALGGTANADDTSLVATAAVSCKALVMFKNTGVDSGSRLICYIDTATGLPFTPAASQTIPITWDNNANAIFRWTGTASAPAPAPAPGGPNDILDVNGNVDATLYSLMAKDYAGNSAMIYRFGVAATMTTAPTLPLRADAGYMQSGGLQQYYAFPPKGTQDGLYMTVQATTIGQPVTHAEAKDASSWIQTGAIGSYAEAYARPQVCWQGDLTIVPYSLNQYIASGQILNTDLADRPICTFRGESGGDAAVSRLSLICTQGSATRAARIFTEGSNTANNRMVTAFPLGYVPTSIALTSNGEFGLVTIWDTTTTTGKVAILAMGEGPDGWVWNSGATRTDWWHTWTDQMHPGLAGQGNFCFAKIIGYVNLPANMKAPTDIKASTGVGLSVGAMYNAQGITGYQIMLSPLSNAGNRARLMPGGDAYEMYAKGGIAIVSSYSEKQICFIDLGPLFAYTNDMYFGSLSNFNQTAASNIGFANNQWPYMLADFPQAYPVIVKQISLADNPVSVWLTPSTSYWGKDDQTRAYEPDGPFSPTPRFPKAGVITRNGTFTVYATGRYAAGVKPTTPVPGDIFPMGSITGLGTQITHMAVCKGAPGVSNGQNNAAMYTDRASRRFGLVSWSTNNNGLTVTLTNTTLIQDSRMDPICGCMTDNYHSTWNMLSAADYTGQAIRNYRFGPLTYGGTVNWSPAGLLTPAGEYEGGITLDCKPFGIYSSNVP